MSSNDGMPRFRVANAAGYIVIRDRDNLHRPVVAFLPNEGRPHAPKFLSEICAKALNDAYTSYRDKK